MVEIIADNITSHWVSTEENYRAVKAGELHALPVLDGSGIPERFTASLFTDERWGEMPGGRFTFWARILIHSADEALHHTGVSLNPERVLFVVSRQRNINCLIRSRPTFREGSVTGMHTHVGSLFR